MANRASKAIQMFISPISETELICRMLEAGVQMTRPEGHTAEDVFSALDPEDRAIWRRAVTAAMDCWRECIENAQVLALAAEQQRADALAHALRNFMNGVSTRAITSDHDETFANACAKARAALAAYEADHA